MALLRNLIRRFRDADRTGSSSLRQTLGAWRPACRARRAPRRAGSDGIAITLPISQEELAGWAGASREAAAKALQQLRELDW